MTLKPSGVLGAGATLMVAFAIAACGSSSSSSSPAPSTSPAASPRTAARGGAAAAPSSGKVVKVQIKNYAYAPAAVTVKAGTKLQFTNADSTAHTATASGGTLAFDTGTIKGGGASGSVIVTKPGTYHYICTFHPFMKATVTVTG
jgi:plastocyanin